MNDLTIQTAYGRLDRTTYEAVRRGFDSSTLLAMVTKLDEFMSEARVDGGLRDEMLRLHSMANTVLNDGPLSVAASPVTLPELADDIRNEIDAAVESFRSWLPILDALAGMAPRD